MYACFSQKAVDFGVATLFYRRLSDGLEIEVTSVCPDPECAIVVWPDKVLLGEVEDWPSRFGRPDTTGLMKYEPIG